MPDPEVRDFSNVEIDSDFYFTWPRERDVTTNLDLRDAETAYERLQKVVLAYLSECDNPVPDYGYRRTLRNQLRQMTGAPAEPPPRS